MGWWGCPVHSQLTFVLGVDSCLCVCPLVFVGVCCPLVFVVPWSVWGFPCLWFVVRRLFVCFCGRLLSLVVVCGLLGCPVLLSFLTCEVVNFLGKRYTPQVMPGPQGSVVTARMDVCEEVKALKCAEV